MSPINEEMQKAISVLPPKVKAYVEEKIQLCTPDKVHVCDGSDAEYQMSLAELEKSGELIFNDVDDFYSFVHN